MKSMDRRTFLKLAGASSAAAAVTALPVAAIMSAGRLSFRATGGLPARPLPAYATQVVEGTIDLDRRRGAVTSQVFAGHADGVSDIALPGLSRVFRITDVTRLGGQIRLTGVIDDRSALIQGENPTVEILIDRAAGLVRAPFAGNQVTLSLAS